MRSLRKTLGLRTCFNILGPLLNPVPVKRQVVGVYSRKLLVPIAEILDQFGIEEAMVIHAEDGLDEISISAPTHVIHLKSGIMTSYTIQPQEYGFIYTSNEYLKGADAATNATIIDRIFSGEPGPHRDIVILNAAAGFLIAGLVDSISEGIDRARTGLDSGGVKHFLLHLKNDYRSNIHEK